MSKENKEKEITLQFPIPDSVNYDLDLLKIHSKFGGSKHKFSLYVLQKGIEQIKKELNQ